MRSAAAGLVLIGLLAGCTSTVPGTARAGPDAAASTGSSTAAGPSPSAAAPSRSALDADVLDDECLLDALEFSELLGEAVLPPEEGDLVRADGTRVSSCVASSAGDFPTPLAAINVYEPRTGTPAQFVQAAPGPGRRDLAGVGEAAVLVATTPGVTMQLASERHVVTIAVLEGEPDDAAWTTAATAALAALPD